MWSSGTLVTLLLSSDWSQFMLCPGSIWLPVQSSEPGTVTSNTSCGHVALIPFHVTPYQFPKSSNKKHQLKKLSRSKIRQLSCYEILSPVGSVRVWLVTRLVTWSQSNRTPWDQEAVSGHVLMVFSYHTTRLVAGCFCRENKMKRGQACIFLISPQDVSLV